MIGDLSEPSQTADTEARYEVRHAVFNPTIMGVSHSPLQDLLPAWEKDGWQLVRVLPHHQYESIAVFERVSSIGSSGTVM